MKKGRFSQRIPHSWLGLGRNGYHHGVARGQVSRTGSELRRKNGNRYVLFLEHRYAITHSPGNLVRLSRAVAGFKNHPPSSRSTYTLMRSPNKRPNGRTEKTITNEALKIAPHLQCTFANPSSRRGLNAAWAVSREPVWAGRAPRPPASRSLTTEAVPLARAHPDRRRIPGASWTASPRANSPAARRQLPRPAAGWLSLVVRIS